MLLNRKTGWETFRPPVFYRAQDRPIFFYVPTPHRVVCRTMNLPGTMNTMVLLPAESVHHPLTRSTRQRMFGICHHCVYKILIIVFIVMIAISYVAWFGVL